jgi:hypothetical protein
MALRLGLTMPDGTAALPGLPFGADPNTGIYRPAADMVSLTSGGTEAVRAQNTTVNLFRPITIMGSSANVARLLWSASSGGVFEISSVSALLTLSTSGTTTDTASIIPAGSIVLAVPYRVTTAITTAASFSIGDATTAARFVSGATGLTLGSTGIGLQHLQGGVATDAAGPVQAAASVVRVTTNANPGAGAIRIQVWYAVLTAPTS